MEGIIINRLITILASCDLQDISIIRSVFNNTQGNTYYLDDVRLIANETHRSTPQIINFMIQIPLNVLSITNNNDKNNIAISDFCLREFAKIINDQDITKNHKTSKENFTGKIGIHTPTNKMLLRNSCFIKNECVNISLNIKFPVHMMEKRNVINGKGSVRIIRKYVVKAINDFVNNFKNDICDLFVLTYTRQREIRDMLDKENLLCFIANGSILPRKTLTDLPLEDAVCFSSPKQDEKCFTFSDGFKIKGMVMKEGVNIITGGGYSGKSTLLDGILSGIYNHIPSDGREYCITRETSIKISAEDGRCVSQTNITPFIKNNRFVNTIEFTTKHASGSTSQASNIMEALTYGCKTLLIDEDKTATNFMIRDKRMKEIIKDDPIVPFTDRVRQLYNEVNISTILIIGGSSEYLDVCDNVYLMKNFKIENYNECIGSNDCSSSYIADTQNINWINNKIIKNDPFSTFNNSIQSNKLIEYLNVIDRKIFIGNYTIDTSKLESIISHEQITAIAYIIRYILLNNKNNFDLTTEVLNTYEKILNEGFTFLQTTLFNLDTNLELPSYYDIACAISRFN